MGLCFYMRKVPPPGSQKLFGHLKDDGHELWGALGTNQDVELCFPVGLEFLSRHDVRNPCMRTTLDLSVTGKHCVKTYLLGCNRRER
jgi:hypothetical protein